MKLASALAGTRTWLILARASNLPTVWSNCLAGWWLGGAGNLNRLAPLLVGASLLYTAGMFLNDFCDAEFDRQYRPERPIPSGIVRRATVGLAGAITMAGGIVCFLPLGLFALLLAIDLALIIGAYDLLHKRVAFGPWLMAACRFLLYPLAASMGAVGAGSWVWIAALGLGAYIVIVSYIARGESRPHGAVHPLWFFALVIIPALCARGLYPYNILLLAYSTWYAWRKLGKTGAPPIAELLAGITLLDLMLAAPEPAMMVWIFGGLYVLARLCQWLIPAS